MIKSRNFNVLLIVPLLLLFLCMDVIADSDSDSIPIDVDCASGTISVSVNRLTYSHIRSTHSIYVSADDDDVDVSWDAYVKAYTISPQTFDENDWDSWQVTEGNSNSDNITLNLYDGDPMVEWFDPQYCSWIIARTHAEVETCGDVFDDWVNATLY